MEDDPKPLARVLACRPTAQNATWAQFLRTHDLEVLEIPLLHIGDIENAENKQRIKDQILKLDQFDAVIFISQNAVKHAFEWIDDFWPALPEQQMLFAIGSKTAAALSNIIGQYYPASNTQLLTNEGAMNSEALLARAELQVMQNKKVLIFKGLGGRDLLAATLAERGARVETCTLYERSLPTEAIEQFANLEFDSERDIFVVFSGETLTNLETVLQQNDSAHKLDVPLIVPGRRVAELAHELEFSQVHIAENASEPAIWQTLQHLLKSKSGNNQA